MREKLRRIWRVLVPLPCKHDWYLLLEKYPSFTKDYWACRKCPTTQICDFDNPPRPVHFELCDLGELHTKTR